MVARPYWRAVILGPVGTGPTILVYRFGRRSRVAASASHHPASVTATIKTPPGHGLARLASLTLSSRPTTSLPLMQRTIAASPSSFEDISTKASHGRGLVSRPRQHWMTAPSQLGKQVSKVLVRRIEGKISYV